LNGSQFWSGYTNTFICKQAPQTGVPDFSWYVQHAKMEKIYQVMTTKYTKQMYGKCTKWPQNKQTSSVARPSKSYPNWDFCFQNIPSGNPAHKPGYQK
jgi:hypothetical protein